MRVADHIIYVSCINIDFIIAFCCLCFRMAVDAVVHRLYQHIVHLIYISNLDAHIYGAHVAEVKHNRGKFNINTI